MKLLKFSEFLLEKISKKVPLQWSKKFDQVLNKIDSPIKDALLELRMSDSDMSLINVTERDDMISFTESSKLYDIFFETEISKKWGNLYFGPLTDTDAQIYNKNRSEIKIGRFIKRLLLDTFSDKEIEKFVNQYKSQFDLKKLQFKFLEGSDIKNGYDSNNFSFENSSPNELINSCMNDQLTLIDFYYSCPVKLLILEDQNGYIWGRSLIWEIKEGVFYMDRIYAVKGEILFKFQNYAKENGWWWKTENKSGPYYNITNGKEKGWIKIEIPLEYDFEDHKEWGVPYLDTFCFMQNNKLMNYEPETGHYYELIGTKGEVLEFRK